MVENTLGKLWLTLKPNSKQGSTCLIILKLLKVMTLHHFPKE